MRFAVMSKNAMLLATAAQRLPWVAWLGAGVGVGLGLGVGVRVGLGLGLG